MNPNTILTRPPVAPPRAEPAFAARDPRFESETARREMTDFLAARERLTDQEAAETVAEMRPAALIYLELELKAALAGRGYSSEYDPFAGVW